MAAVVFGIVRHTQAVAVSRTTPRAVASFASSTEEPIHAFASPRRTIALATVGALYKAVSGVSSRCHVAPSNAGRAHSLRAIAPAPAGPAITSSDIKAYVDKKQNSKGRAFGKLCRAALQYWPTKHKLPLFD